MHIGLIMDGNGRWAKQRSLPRSAGHLEGLKAARRIIEAACSNKVDYLTLYVFSTENWNRPQQEVDFLMNLIATKLPEEVHNCVENNIRILARGDMSGIPEKGRKALTDAITSTSSCTGMTLIACINYGGQDEISRAVNKFIKSNPGKEITTKDIEMNLDCPNVPAPDLIARSAGEFRLSNFMLWDSAYAEFLSIEKLWPDWGEEELLLCISELGKRVRKFGGLVK